MHVVVPLHIQLTYACFPLHLYYHFVTFCIEMVPFSWCEFVVMPTISTSSIHTSFNALLIITGSHKIILHTYIWSQSLIQMAKLNFISFLFTVAESFKRTTRCKRPTAKLHRRYPIGYSRKLPTTTGGQISKGSGREVITYNNTVQSFSIQ